MFAICNLSLVPVRKEASDKSEMISQLLFGESVEVEESKGNWRKVRMIHDDYKGWVDKKQIIEIADDEFNNIQKSDTVLSNDLVQLVIWGKNQICPIVYGSTLPFYNNRKFFIGRNEYSFEGNIAELKKQDLSRLVEIAYLYLNAPYLWGGRSPFGLDCSGFTQMVFKLCGVKIHRDAKQQAEMGTPVNLLEESRTGDLAFFDNADGKITHVGILLQSSQIIHCSGRVRIDRIDHQGIFNDELKSYTHNLRLIKRMVN
jgi:cell wall-associated NlpC family hydrolase